MNKKAAAKVLSSFSELRRQGDHYFGICNRELISGYALDAPPGGIYVARFILPAYDSIEFLHMALGKRIAQFPRDETDSGSSDLGALLRNDWQAFSSVRDCGTLVAYLDRERVEGEYCQWTRYLTHVRGGEFESADRMQHEWQSSGFPRMQLVVQNMRAVLAAKESSGWNGVQDLLTEWSDHNMAKFCH